MHITLVALAVAFASTGIRISFDDASRQADRVVVVRALSQSSQWDDGRIVTHVVTRVESTLAGVPAPGELVVRVNGGTVDNVRQWTEGEPAFEPGQRYVLWTHALDADRVNVVGRAQGELRIACDTRCTLVPAASAGHIVERANARASVLSLADAFVGKEWNASLASRITARWEKHHGS